MKIETDDFILRKWKAEDAKEYISFAQKEDSLSELFAIEVDGRVIGSIGAFLKEDVYRKNAEIGYYLAEDYWGKGLMTKAIKSLVKYLFDSQDINRVYAEPFARNIGSRKALEKAGFRLEAVLKSNVIKNCVIEDSCIYAVLKDDFID